MAYREFHVEKIYEAPDVNILAEGLMEGAKSSAEAIGNLFRGLSEQQIAKRKGADQYKFDLGEGKFENDDKIFFEKSNNITQRGKQDILRQGAISPELQKDQMLSLQEKKQSDWQFKAMEQHDKDIDARAKEDKYYDPEVDKNKLRVAAYGEDGDVYYGTRGDRLEEFDKVKGIDPKSLKGKLYTYDYVGLFREKEKTKSTGSPTSESTVFDKTPFLNEQGAPGITMNHAKEYLNSRQDGSVARWVESLVNDDMDADVRYMKQKSPEFKGLSDDEVKLYLKSNPSENQYNKKDYATRVIDKAQEQLFEAANISKKIDYTTKVDKSMTGGLYNNDAIGHSYTNHTDTVGTEATGVSDKVAGAFKANVNTMPGGSLRIGKGAKIGGAIPVDLNPQNSYNLRTGKNDANKGTTSYNLTGYQLGVYKKDGSLVPIDANTIDKIPLSEFKNLEPEMKIALRGYTVDQGNKLGEIATKQSELDDEIGAAVKSGDVEKQQELELKLQQLNGLKQKMNLSQSEFSDDDLFSAFKQAGMNVNSVKKDVIIKASQADLDLINKNITQGLNLADENKRSPEMQDLNKRYKARAEQAAAAGYADRDPSMEKFAKDMAKKKPAKQSTSQTPTVTTAADYANLPPGSQYIDPSGNLRTKTKK